MRPAFQVCVWRKEKWKISAFGKYNGIFIKRCTEREVTLFAKSFRAEIFPSHNELNKHRDDHLRRYIKHTRRCLTTFPNTSTFVKNTPPRVVFLTLSSVFGNVLRHAFRVWYITLQSSKTAARMPHYLFFPTLAAVLQGMNPAEDFFVTTDAFLETPTLYKRKTKSGRHFTKWCSCQWNFMPTGTHLPPRCPWFVDVLFRFCGLIRPGFGSLITNQGYYNRTQDG